MDSDDRLMYSDEYCTGSEEDLIDNAVAAAAACYAAVLQQRVLKDRRRRTPTANSRSQQGRSAIQTLAVLYGPPKDCLRTTGVNQRALNAIIHKLIDDYDLVADHHVGAAEQVIIFLELCTLNSTPVQLEQKYRQPLKTILNIISKLSKLLCRLSTEVVKLPGHTTVRHASATNSKWPGCIGTLACTHIPVNLLPFEPHQVRWRHKDLKTQNVLGACDFSGNFVYVLAGYEGSAPDMWVLEKAQKGNKFEIREGCYYLASRNISSKVNECVTPYQEKYHFIRFKEDVERKEREELYNVLHVQMREEGIDRLWAILKSRWRILAEGPSVAWPTGRQVQFVYALAAVHNFINQHGQPAEKEVLPEASVEAAEPADKDNDEDEDQSFDPENESDCSEAGEIMDEDDDSEESIAYFANRAAMRRRRDMVAMAVWKQHQAAPARKRSRSGDGDDHRSKRARV